jgi:hypothetical protein
MVYGVATREWDGWKKCVNSWLTHASRPYPFRVVSNRSVLEAFQEIYESTTEPIISLCHDDLEIYEYNWDRRVLNEFNDPSVGLVGFAGGLGHGLPQMYKEPFHIPNLIRRDFISNMGDAEKHGYRFVGETDVAVLDGLALFVRRSVLDRWECGWPVNNPIGYFMYSENLCCEVRRQGLRIRLVGVDCLHLGGKSSSGAPLPHSYEEEHKYFWDTNRDVMPYYVS